MLRWLCFEQSSVMPCLGWARWIRRRTAADHPLRARLPGYDEEGRAALAAMERWLAGRSFFAGDRYGIADIALYGYTHSAEEGGFARAERAGPVVEGGGERHGSCRDRVGWRG